MECQVELIIWVELDESTHFPDFFGGLSYKI